ncbi:MAG: general secretion pathway protein GspK [Verrucomicrobia bacterium]|nr:general secretion pathway protein GspK [Verrucomicrobiota bacterium]
MKIGSQKTNRGIAMIIVMVVVFVLGIMAAGFAYSMKVEMRLAQQASYESEFEWLGRSGVELARCVLVEQFKNRAAEPYDALNQKWAGGEGGTNVLPEIFFEDVELGNGRISITIEDAERKFNVNRSTPPTLVPEILNRTMIYVGVDASEASVISDSIQDWIDPDQDERVSGAESKYYLQQEPPYEAKNGPMADITEMLLIKGIQENPAIFWGSNSTNYVPGAFMTRGPGFRERPQPVYTVGLNDLFTTVSMGRVNGNTASAHVLQMILGDTNAVSLLLQRRQGQDGQDGTADDMPFRSVGEISSILNGIADPAFINQVFGVNSFVFEVNVTCEIGGLKRDYVALIHRINQRDINILYLYWKRPHKSSGDATGT